MKDPVTVYVADDHEMILSGARTWLAEIDEFSFSVVGTTTDSTVVLDEILERKPDIAILDVGFPKSPSGLTLTQDIDANDRLDTDPVITTRFNNHPYFWKAIASGAKAYIPKGEGSQVFKAAMVTVAGGGKYIPEHLIRGDHFDEKMEKLSARQLEWARHFARGNNPKEAAELMNIQRNTIYKFKTRVKDKLLVDDDAKLREMLGHYFEVPDWETD